LDGYSLTDLMEQMGSLNEANLCKLTIQLVHSFSEYEEKFGTSYGELCACEILFDKSGNLKVTNNIIIFT
jgi:hypothetical protein